jgi:hypothetical protein
LRRGIFIIGSSDMAQAGVMSPSFPLRGLILALPLSLALWGAMYVTARGVVSPDYRHGLKTRAHHVLAVARHDASRALAPQHRA